MSPKVSVITVTYNAVEHLEETLRSIFTQTFEDYEVIVVDGGSTDGTIDVIRAYENRITRWVSEPDNGIYDAMNKGLEMAGGEYVNFLNAGDYYVGPEVLAELFTDLSPETDVVYGDIIILHTDGTDQTLKAKEFSMDELLGKGTSVVCHQAIFARRSIAPRYSDAYRFKGELNWYFDLHEAADRLNYRHRPVPVVYYRMGGFGHKHFVKNRVEWLRLVLRRYGAATVWRHGLLGYIYRNSFWRYPGLRRFHERVVRPLGVPFRLAGKIFRR